MLSAQEHQRLIDIERRLRASDPDLARVLNEGPLGQRTPLERIVAFFRRRPGSPGPRPR
ncbi:DUF3040 domain-containing protein [Lentzea sp. NPDC055074]